MSGAPHHQLDLVSDSRSKLSKYPCWVDASIHLNSLPEQASSFFLGDNLGTECSL